MFFASQIWQMEESSKTMDHCSILIVEDEESIRQLYQMMLEIENYNVLLASNGQEALEKLEKCPNLPCLVILDLMMPVMNGWQFVEAVKKVKEYADIPIIVVTAFRDKADTIKANGFMLKPIELDQFLKVVGKYCRHRKNTK